MIRDNIVRVQVTKISPNPWNPNRQTDFIYDKERTSIRKFGFLDPILVRERDGRYEIIDGEHRWKAAQDEGLQEVPVNNLGFVTDAVAKQLTIVLNETRGRADRVDLAKLIQQIKDDVGLEEMKENLPYAEGELDSFLSQNDIDWNSLNVPATSPSTTPPTNDGAEKIVTVSFKLPLEAADALEAQVERFRQALYATGVTDPATATMAIQAMCEHLARHELDGEEAE
jgi:hypothetical protein